MTADKPIENISDTALWVAVYRAMESERPDAHFHDPYARLLAGDKGEEIVEKMPWAKSSAWAMIVRTCVFDELILKVIQRDGVDTILNLAAGLDTRPYRLQLPSTLRWIEVDLPGILDYKEAKLAGQKPACLLERVRLDLSDASGRDALFSRVDASAKRVLVLTEGLLVYLPSQAVIGLAKDLASRRTFQYWLIDIASPVLLKWLNQRFGKTLALAGVQMQFAPAEGADFFAPHGWEIDEFRPTGVEARRLNRNLPHAWLWRIMGIFSSKEQREGFQKVGMALLRRKV
jgi:methyltransferase (TIGR00027 family)